MIKNKKTILVIHPSLCIGGSEKMISFVCNALSSKFEVILVLLDKKDKFQTLNSEIKIIELDTKSDSALHELGFIKSLQYFRRVKTQLTKVVDLFSPDSILAFNDRIVFMVWSFFRRRGIPLVFSQRSAPEDKSLLWNLILRIIYNNCKQVSFQLEQVRKFYLPINKGIVIPNPAVRKIENKVNLDREKTILVVSRFQKRKRVDLILEAFSHFVKEFPDYHLKIYGDGEMKTEWIELTSKLNLEESVSFLGYDPKAFDHNPNAGMFVLGSDSEGIPNSLIEAMAHGIPCISTDCYPGGARFLLDDGKNGILVSRNSSSEIFQAMKKIVEDRDQTRQYIINSLTFLKILDPSLISKQWIDLFNFLED